MCLDRVTTYSLDDYLIRVYDIFYGSIMRSLSKNATSIVYTKNYIPENCPIIPELFLILLATYYSKNYSGIMYSSLIIIYVLRGVGS